jgi:hypothetical protein
MAYGATKETHPHILEYVGPITPQELTLWERYFREDTSSRAEFSHGLKQTKEEYRDLIMFRLGSHRILESTIIRMLTELHGAVADIHDLGNPEVPNFWPSDLKKPYRSHWNAFQVAFNRIMGINSLDLSGEVPKYRLLKDTKIYEGLGKGLDSGQLALRETTQGFETTAGININLPARVAFYRPDFKNSRNFEITGGYEFGSTKPQAISFAEQQRQTFADLEALNLVRQAMTWCFHGTYEDPNPPASGIDVPIKLVIGNKPNPSSGEINKGAYNDIIFSNLESVKNGALLALCYVAGERDPFEWRNSLSDNKSG